MQVYALTKERDALRRGSDKLNSINELLKEKDNIIAQVCTSSRQAVVRLQQYLDGSLACLLYRLIVAAAYICPAGHWGSSLCLLKLTTCTQAVALGPACR